MNKYKNTSWTFTRTLFSKAIICLILVNIEVDSSRADHIHIPETSSDEETFHLFTFANVISVIYHELGHALIDDYSIPVLAREEDAADAFAVLMVLDNFKEEFAHQAIVYWAYGWALGSGYADSCNEDLLTSDVQQQSTLRGYRPKCGFQEFEKEELAGTHMLARQRYYMTLCIAAGLSSSVFADIALATGMSEEQVDNCAQGEHTSRLDSWNRLLEEHRAIPNVEYPQRGKVDVLFEQPVGSIWLNLNPEGSLKDFQDISTWFSEMFVLPDNITIAFRNCSEKESLNAYWDFQNRKVEICYDLVDQYALLLEDHIAKHQQNKNDVQSP